ncbi:portal protein [Massilia sp. GER05]|uniref:portal protein n=1 Tax=Massilia sp. GER05 TaxID=3394605 RepID=UPI003F854F44
MSTHDNDGAGKGANTDAGLLKEVREFVEHAISADSDNRDNARADLRFEAGDQWPEQIKAQRQREGRPCLTFNRLPTYKRQVTNDQRQNKSGIKVHPVGDGADVKKAGILQGIIRHIEYSSNADICYDTAVNSAASIGWGFWRLVTEYESPMSFNQVIRFKRERDAMKVYFDPNSVEADGSDAKRCAIVWDMASADFKRTHPNVDVPIGAAAGCELQPGWMDTRYVRMVEFYYFEQTRKTIYLLDTGDVVEKVPDGGVVKAQRETLVPQLKWVKTAGGTKVLERTDIMCRWIPVFPVWGNEIDIDGKVIRSGIIRDAKDPAQMYNFWMTSATEEVSLRPKTPFIGAEGQFEGHEKKWAQANNKSFAYLEYKPVSIDGVLAPPPQRSPMADVPVGMLQMAVHAADNIKAVTGLFDASLGAAGNETSGKAITARQREGDTANFHYTDNLNRSIRHCGRCLVDMIPHYYDAQRVVQILNEDETISAAEINKPAVDEQGRAVDEQGQPVVDPVNQVQAVLNDMTVGTYDVTIGTGPSYATQRQEAADGMERLASAWPKLMDVAGDKVVAALDWPGSEEIAARIKATIPGQITQADKNGEDGEEQGPAPLPPEIEQALQNADQMVEQLQQQLAEAQAGHQAALDKARLDAASREEVARINAQGRADVAELTGLVNLLLARIPPPAGLVAAAAETEDSRPAGSQPADPAQTTAQPE